MIQCFHQLSLKLSPGKCGKHSINLTTLIGFLRNVEKKQKLLDINSEQAQEKPDDKTASNKKLSAAQKGVEFCNRLFYGKNYVAGLKHFHQQAEASWRRQ